MITRTAKIRQTPIWQKSLASSIKSYNELLEIIQLDAHQLNISEAAIKQFSLRIPRAYVDCIKPGDPNDPLLKQILPVNDEMFDTTNFVTDPVADHKAIVANGVLQKYRGRALLLTTGACAIHCRYCFRRHFPYAEANAAHDEWKEAIDYLEANNDISEVILSGGDPLTLSDERLSSLIKKIEKIKHINTLRIHTRLPVVLPERVCEALFEWITNSRLHTVIVIHCNHIQEISPRVASVLKQLKQAGITLLNQSVLLKGINDTTEDLKALSLGLFEAGTLPYYLHQLDPVSGAAHFQVNDQMAVNLVNELQTELPGYLVPRLVREIAGKASKTYIY